MKRTFADCCRSASSGPRVMLPLVAAACGLSPHAFAQTIDWSSASGGSWFAPANWTPNAVPSGLGVTARIGGTAPLNVGVDAANASIGTLLLINSNATLRLFPGRELRVDAGATVNGTLELGDATPTGFCAFRLGTFAGFSGDGVVLFRAPPGDASRAQLVAGAAGATWPKDLRIRGTGRISGSHFIVGTAVAESPGNALEFSAGIVNGLGSGEFIADGGILRSAQARFFDATLRAINNGVIEFSAPVASGSASPLLANNCVLRGPTRFVRNTTVFDKTDVDSDMDLRPNGSLTFQSYGAGTRFRAVVNSQGVAPASVLTLAPGDPGGAGTITLNAPDDARDALLVGNNSVLGPDWTINGQGTIQGNLTLNTRMIADRATGQALTFRQTLITGNGSIEARAGALRFGDGARLDGVRVLGDPGRQAVVQHDGFGASATWTNVSSGIGIDCRNVLLTLNGCSIQGPVRIDAADLPGNGAIKLAGVASDIFGDITIRRGGLSGETGVTLGGAGQVILDPSGPLDSTTLNLYGVSLGSAWTIRGAGYVYITGDVHSPIRADDPAGRSLVLGGELNGAPETPITVSTGELVINKRALVKGFRFTGTPNAKPVRVGLDDFFPFGSDVTLIQIATVDVPMWFGQFNTRVRGTQFNAGMDVRGSTQLLFETEARCSVQGDMAFVPLGSQSVPFVSGRAPAGRWRAVFRNIATGVRAGVLAMSEGGLLEADLVGTGIVSSFTRYAGAIAPSDESGANGPGLLQFQSSDVAFEPATSVDIDILDMRRYDRITSTGNVIVNGTLSVRAPADFYPPPSYDFLFIRGKCTGAFTKVEPPPGFRAEMRYNFMGASIRLVKRCASDFDESGTVDEADFQAFAASYALVDCKDPFMPSGCPADLDRDLFVDDTDFSMFAVAFDRALCD